MTGNLVKIWTVGRRFLRGYCLWAMSNSAQALPLQGYVTDVDWCNPARRELFLVVVGDGHWLGSLPGWYASICVNYFIS